ncbi:nitroreductase family deazaflavin-dependent oxidoreductase [Actinocorallia sp. A-T 12471]|uniref:nitroreductase family deazaflavin-dependent oxidoreductase n=1 Tax=Actinocorallia sp. A-T 12471 TaxID=3089813 RepID=UPI0029CF2BA2|nr:nitroreductase family deazaflavin-dependent oxidoreductase [Actinocorallia sp. A-T 12471]MDX6738853.1 nitroreductase family deazaflavin-dependent oxidoreductase [Actinocorallia sp. A-T 12471]
MPLEGEYVPSPYTQAAEQVELYESTGGEEGNTMGGKPVIILTTRGAKTGKIRKAPLMRVTDGESYAVVASKGGAPDNPVWYHNILAEPLVMLQDGPEPREYRAHLAEGLERDQWWQRAVEAWPGYADYQKKTDRKIPVFVLDPA